MNVLNKKETKVARPVVRAQTTPQRRDWFLQMRSNKQPLRRDTDEDNRSYVRGYN